MARAVQATYEPFMGSCTTLIASETTGRVCLGIKLNPAYVDVVVRRWQKNTGKQAVLDGDGTPHDNHPHSGLKMHSPREFIAAQTTTA